MLSFKYMYLATHSVLKIWGLLHKHSPVLAGEYLVEHDAFRRADACNIAITVICMQQPSAYVLHLYSVFYV